MWWCAIAGGREQGMGWDEVVPLWRAWRWWWGSLSGNHVGWNVIWHAIWQPDNQPNICLQCLWILKKSGSSTILSNWCNQKLYLYQITFHLRSSSSAKKLLVISALGTKKKIVTAKIKYMYIWFYTHIYSNLHIKSEFMFSSISTRLKWIIMYLP